MLTKLLDGRIIVNRQEAIKEEAKLQLNQDVNDILTDLDYMDLSDKERNAIISFVEKDPELILRAITKYNKSNTIKR